MNRGFWKGRRIFLTGHTGFKGSWMSLWLQSLGAELTGYALKPSSYPSLFEAARVADGMVSIEGDIRDTCRLRSALHNARPQIVFHMAAQPLVRQSYDNPVDTYATNVMGVVNLFEAIRAVPDVRTLINITTDKCYENKEWLWGYRENDPLGGYDPYSSSKACAEIVSAAYRSSFFNPSQYQVHGVAVATARAGNVIGGGDWARDRLIPDILQAFELGQTARIRNPSAIRPWQHVLEPLRGYLTLAEKLVEDGAAYGEAWNFGPDDVDAKPVSWIADRMVSHWGGRVGWVVDDGDHPHEASYLKLDISKARMRLNWQPAIGLSDALHLTIDWVKRRHDGKDVRAITLSQIDSYQKNFKI